ncbi:MAG: LptF/LptG family permease [Candidatus Hydrogenedens sp.]|nr:LptF/LptG family permease [Candidatus Hydrogenedens sp.]
MKIVARYILQQIWVPALMSAAVVAFLITTSGIRDSINVLFEQVPFVQLRFLDIFLIAAFTLPSAINYILPITFMFGIMFAFGRLAANSELVALRAAGISLRRIVSYVLLFGGVLSVGCFALQNVAQPWAMTRLSDLLMRDVPLRMSIDTLPVGVMHQFGGWQIYVGGHERGGTLTDIMMLQPEPDGGATTFYAERAHVESTPEGSRIVMEHGHYIPATAGDEVRRVTFSSLSKSIPRVEPSEEIQVRHSLTISKMLAREQETAQRFEETGALPVMAELRKDRIEIGQRFSLPLMCLAAAMLATPLGARTKRAGRSYAFATGLGVVVAYFTLVNLSLPPFVPSLAVAIAMAQIPNITLAAAGLAAIYRVDRV